MDWAHLDKVPDFWAWLQYSFKFSMQILQIMTYFPCIMVGSSIIGYNGHAYYRQQKGQYTLHFCTEWLKEIFCVPSLKLLCGNSGREGNVFLKQSLVRGVWVYYSWIPIWRRYNGLRIVLNNQRMNDPANMPSRGSVQFSAVPSGPALGFSVGRLEHLGRHLWNTWVYYNITCERNVWGGNRAWH